MTSPSRRQSNFFAHSQKESQSKYEVLKNTGYDLEWDYDKELISVSIFSSYGIPPTKQLKMHVGDYLSALSGLDGDSQLGRVIRARTEKSTEKLTDWDYQQRSKWNLHVLKVRQEYMSTLSEEEQKEAKIKEDEAFRLAMKAALGC